MYIELNMKSLIVLSVLLAATYGFNDRRIDSSSSWRIVGGSDAPDGLYPHQVAVQKRGNPTCSGSILSAEWVITAAQCVNSQPPHSLRIQAGVAKLSEGGYYYQVLEVHVHEKLSGKTGQNDIALLKVEPMKLTDKVAPIALERDDIPGNVPVTMIGWGAVTEGGALPDNLQHIHLKSISVEECQRILNGTWDWHISETQICTSLKVGEGSCMGDGGNSLIKETEDGQRTLVGLASWGVACARGYPDVFTRMSSFVEWVNDKCNCLNVYN